MIKYDAGSFGFAILFRLHGSAVFKSIFPALISSALFLILYFYADIYQNRFVLMYHPYPMTALIAALTFLLAFRANFAYNRYWEAFTAIHQMHSKWIDVAMDVAAFHLQSDIYANKRPPAFGSHPELQFIERERERRQEMSYLDLQEHLEEVLPQKGMHKFLTAITVTNAMKARRRKRKERKEKKEKEKDDDDDDLPRSPKENRQHNRCGFSSEKIMIGNPGMSRKHDRRKTMTVASKIRTLNHSGVWKAGDRPVFLEECAHLLSLLSAVALSTLRNDLETASTPLITFVPGEPFPHVDPDDYTADVRREWTKSTHRTVTVLRYLFGSSRTPAARTLYNAARPFRVFGGVSDAEIEMLQAARGPLAKVALCTMWVQEFISR